MLACRANFSDSPLPAFRGASVLRLPGLIDVHVHLSSPGGMSTNGCDYDIDKVMLRDAAALLLYSVVTAARSTGDGLDSSLKVPGSIANGSKLGAQLMICGPMFTAEGGHGTEYTQNVPVALQDIGAMERISLVVFKGERLHRPDRFDQK